METLSSIETGLQFLFSAKIHIFPEQVSIRNIPYAANAKEAVHKFYPEYALQTVISGIA